MIDHKEFARLKGQIFSTLEINPCLSDSEVKQLVEDVVFTGARQLIASEKKEWIDSIFHAIRGLDVLQKWVDTPEVTEIMVNRYDQIFIERNGRLERTTDAFESPTKLEDLIQMMVSKVNRVVNESSPIVDARWNQHLRVHIVLPPVALDGPVLTLRKFPQTSYTLDYLVERTFMTEEVANFLRTLVRCKFNLLISGGTNSGKTTLLNALANELGDKERVVTIEDSAELRLHNIANLIRLETKNANAEGLKEIPMWQLIKAALRMRPDRIIVGEVRGREAIDMLQAMNTGHDGSMSTAHANSAADMLSRLETMILSNFEIPLSAIRAMMMSSLDVIVHLNTRRGVRHIAEICELAGIQGDKITLNRLFEFGDNLMKVGELKHIRKLEWYG